ncbi:MAG: N-acylglucosamine 2-epimerase (GlcNAc 2-epimerase) [Firmicutes bacterium ADurb.Bin193]|nr:MAG: N-acylglucosamine 2-epimerase (GlcNAc 2-epimerase) [Firmicutes bacterium ADurb.Bin193]
MKFTNRLINEKSPYLLQHAHNPVDWYPWGEEAFNKAKAEDKPIFMSVGYSTCHWCHVMERESFVDEDVAKILNDSFVCIKLDREERPDIDHIYMEVCQATTGSGGWPLTIFMDSEKKPFFAGTYYPKHTLIPLLWRITELWTQQREVISQTAENIRTVLGTEIISKGKADFDVPEKAFFHLKRSFDPTRGGFGGAPKFPSPHVLLFLMRYSEETGDKYGLEMAVKTLESMYRGGIYDHIGHGFCRYSTDGKWLVPHFEKMLYDNALLALAYAQAFGETNNPLFFDVACNTLGYMKRVLENEGGGFRCAEDADSEGVEGLFYVWQKSEVDKILGADSKEFCNLYNITDEGNFEGHNILNLIGKDVPADKKQWANECLKKLFVEREKRVHPFLDDKILVSWNGLAIAAFAYAGKVFKKSEYTETAARASEFIEKNLSDGRGGLLSRYRDGEAKYAAHAEDYAFYTWGLIELYQATHQSFYLKRAIELTDIFMRDFWDDENGGFRFAAKQSAELIINPKPLYDGAMPSANSVSALSMLRLYSFTGDRRFEDVADKIFNAFSGELSQSPPSYCFMMYAMLYKKADIARVVIKADTQSNVKRLVEVIPPKAEVAVYVGDELSEYSGNYALSQGVASAYVCRGGVCLPPVTDEQSLKAIFANA